MKYKFPSLHILQVSAERGLSWQSAVRLWSDLVTNEEGFYISQLVRVGKREMLLLAK